MSGSPARCADRPVVVQHVAGRPGHGGPATALDRLMASTLAEKYDLVTIRQTDGAGGIDVPLIRAWVRQLRAIKPDIVHIRGLGNEGFHGAVAAKVAGCPRILVSVHGTVRDLRSPGSARRAVLTNAVEPATLAMATHISTVCRAAADRSYLDRFRHKLVAVVPNGVDVRTADPVARQQLRQRLDLGQDDVAVIVVGRLTTEKGHLVLAEALEKLGPAGNRVVLLVAGDGPDSAAIEGRYRSVPNVRLRMLGHRDDIGDLLSAADIFAFPTLHENLSNALIEAMAAGLPVVATAVGGNVEVLEHGGGQLVPPHDPEALAASLATLIVDRPYRTATGAKGSAAVREHFSMQRMVNGWDSVYREMLASS